LGHRFANHGSPNGQHQKDFKHVATTVVDKKFQRGKNSRMSLHRKTKKDYGSELLHERKVERAKD
jgi:hypothetical protein